MSSAAPLQLAPQSPARIPSSSAYLISGVLAGASQTLFWHPIDLVKVRLQVQDARIGGTPEYRSLAHVVRSIFSNEGWPAFFRGAAPNVVGSSLAWGIQMPVYNALKEVAQSESSRSTTTTKRTYLFWAPRDIMCSFIAGCLTNVIVHPVFLVKTRMQLQRVVGTQGGSSASVAGVAASAPAASSTGSCQPYRGGFHTTLTILREEGAVGLYRGFLSSLLLSSHGSLLLVSYDHFKFHCPSVVPASLCAKVFATVVTYPFQVVRAVMQQRPEVHGVQSEALEITSFRETVHTLWKRGGVRAFYRGMVPQMMRTVPQAVTFFSLYEQVLKALAETSALGVPAVQAHEPT
eukprot:TRINITY_DN69689_c0_g1_i1.p1 TRINITY_DN69689_c0_g1~~TRINITY_DN69689_c0_g1_i1.p1  ORF type:complete len:368 (-),score=38.68 TRINITY_DN69689_c0_g1_i1:176-1219(-)